jgi:hypothetical protein
MGAGDVLHRPSESDQPRLQGQPEDQHHADGRIFALTVCRMWLAYRNGCFRYGLFVCR